ncbi:MAG: macro domain-containing protein [Phycisphaeraceae bacterium]|nr:macro domain-containing protein [Phycisphaerales bacterium]MCB9859710.1 macro domain-containing protein [Phycisphaeraceae bacterium]
MTPEVVKGDMLDQRVDAIVNAWNRNIIPQWLLLPQGVSRAIRKRAGKQPFRELARHGPIPLGAAVVTSAGELPYKAIIHVAGINLRWFATEKSIKDSVVSAMRCAEELGMTSIALPIIGSGSGNRSRETAITHMKSAFAGISSGIRAVIVEYQPGSL